MLNQKRAGTLLSYVQLLLNLCIGIVYTPIMLHYLGQSEYGVYSVATAVISFLTMLDLGFTELSMEPVVCAEGDAAALSARFCKDVCNPAIHTWKIN